MMKTSVYLPGDLTARAKALDLNVSAICRKALETAVLRKQPEHCPRCGQPLPKESS